MFQDSELDLVASLLEQAQRILFITGAGISADSGLPTYRGIGGLYHDRLTAEGLTIEEALSGEMMALRPDISWKYIAEIEANCRGARPNAAHRLIAAFEQEKAMVCVLTQNVDGLHADAGSHNLIEMHGTVHRLRCNDCTHARQVADYAGLQLPPECPRCGGVMRPDIVLFGEQLPVRAIERLEHMLQAGVDLVVSIGTTSVFPYIAGPVVWAARDGVPTVEINPGDTEVSRIVRHRLRMTASEAMHELWYRIHPHEPAED
ncbi:NAD-dependent deacylase [Thauera linaloolentis]|uniref:protein acetyllysine N-acetyltransferase n=1 Tax=Thauera linaloolentis (strain DSM 12138 / JCM 21573 / CCUG 41526 / CIP 105981 / IAM 15112 / NBRC 102519 / 47Lol) TaxID=1123367 RepID=N6YRG0_THAL4|nr:NAD-dependent deacylase [Thauera linaloolentis]ENO84932.1 NAD-dependent deacetylase [Thauera linaloolentis 47Lol = DSM 12138]MCM8566793.1 NAD-dependent deacylase [Thauera linaloolentis]